MEHNYMHSYQLINPSIEGTFEDTYDANDQLGGAEKMWLNMSKHIVGFVPRFLFTMKNISTSKLHHFEVAENGGNNKYTIKELDIEIDPKFFDEFLKNIDSFSKKKKSRGGSKKPHRKRYEDDSSSSSSSDNFYPTIRRTDPIAIFNYTPRVYFGQSKTIIETPVFGVPIIEDIGTTLNPTISAVFAPVYTPIFAKMSPFVAIW